MQEKTTDRGFAIYEFVDTYGAVFSLQKSSSASEDKLWIGIANPDVQHLVPGKGWVNYPMPEEVHISSRGHINVEMAKDIIEILQKFVDTGNI